jgi:ribosomal protein S18 acetylase RimI-like enzyme
VGLLSTLAYVLSSVKCKGVCAPNFARQVRTGAGKAEVLREHVCLNGRAVSGTLLQAAEGGLDASSKLPADSSSSGGDGSVGGAGATNGAARHAQLVVATCDLNRGRNLPAEELVGRWPQAAADGHDPSTQRAYLSNVCVASGVRRFGLARQLILAVEAAAAAAGVSHMYVHVVHDNTPAVKLYQQVCQSVVRRAARLQCAWLLAV